MSRGPFCKQHGAVSIKSAALLLLPPLVHGVCSVERTATRTLPQDFTFVHPGVLINATMLSALKVHVASGAEPWRSIFKAALDQQFSSLNYTATPRATVECGSYDRPSFGCADERNDAAAAYIHALLWAATNVEAHARKSAEIMDAWSAVLVKHNNSNAPLQSAWVGSVFPRAAEIIKHTWGGWPTDKVERFEGMLTSVYLPLIIDGCFNYNGNWELSMAEAIMAIGTLTDNVSVFDKGLQFWRGRVPGYFYLSTDGPTPFPPDNSTESKEKVVSNWHGQKVFSGHDGLCQETCRDLGHTQMGLAAAINGAETALHQGIDLYGEESGRLTAAMEFHAKLVLPGALQPGDWLCDGAVSGIGKQDPTWEIAYNHYKNRLGFSNLTNTAAVISVVRPTGVGLHMVDESLSHAANW